MPKSIDTHKPDCACPACQGRRGEREARSPMLGFRVAPDVHAWLQARPEGPRRWLETIVREAQGHEVDRQWWYDHIHSIVVGAIKQSEEAHGDTLPSSVGKRVASQLVEELVDRRMIP